MPRTRREILMVISALASAISSRTRSCTFSVTSWIASPNSEGRGSVIARDRPEDLREQERAREGRTDRQLGTVRRGLAAPARGRGGGPRRALGGGRLGARLGGRADPGRAHGRTRDLPRRVRARGRALRRLPGQALGLLGLLARPLGLGGGRLGLLAGLALFARQLLLLLLRGGDLLLGAAHVGLGGHLVDLGDARLALRAGRLGGRLAVGRGGLRLLGGGHALG